ncbi:MAG TPA: amidohydrolase, partial [Firmicutes bacterium]|nr:amidohydrolase [Bacillota bacterium]
MLLQSFEKALLAYPRSDHQHRIEHLEIPRPDHFERAARLGVAVAMQPAFDYYWGQRGGDYEATLGPERWSRSNALKSALEAGVLVAGGSDAG